MIDAKPGEWCKVPCLRIEGQFYGMDWVPVLGEKHCDAEIGAQFEHYHIDWRFMPQRVLDRCASWRHGAPHGSVISRDIVAGPHRITGAPVLKRRKCKRPMPDFPAMTSSINFIRFEKVRLEACARLKDGHTCPHRGIDLRPFAKPDGTAVCPGHGLHWNLRTGELIPRHSAT